MAYRTARQKKWDKNYNDSPSGKAYRRKYNKKDQDNRVARAKARRLLEKKHGKAYMKGKEVHHKDGNPQNNSPSNLKVASVNYNRKKNGSGKKQKKKQK